MIQAKRNKMASIAQTQPTTPRKKEPLPHDKSRAISQQRGATKPSVAKTLSRKNTERRLHNNTVMVADKQEEQQLYNKIEEAVNKNKNKYEQELGKSDLTTLNHHLNGEEEDGFYDL